MNSTNRIPSQPRMSARDIQKHETRERVYRASLEIFRRDGYQAAAVEDIAQLAGVSRGTFYFHFPTKDDVLAELLRRSEAPVVAAVEQLPAEATVASLLQTIVGSVLTQWQGDTTLFPEVGAYTLRQVAVAKSGEADPLRAAVARRFQLAAQRGHLTRHIDPGTLSDVFLLSAFAVLMAWAHQPTGSLDEALQQAVKLFLDGARPSV